jgi:1-acyl-sn-glycerol-3-phosphate acyltransferase
MDSSTVVPLDVASDALDDTAGQEPASSEQNIMKNMARFRSNPLEFFQEVAVYARGRGWRSYDNDKVVGQPVFYSGYTDMIKTATMRSTMLQRRLADMTEARLQIEEKEGLLDKTSRDYLLDRLHRRAEIEASLIQITNNMLDRMVCKMESKATIRTAYYVCTNLLTRAYHQGVHVSRAEVARLKEVAAKCALKKQSIIFLPRHTSHADYVALQLICYRLGITLPVVVAGDNLNFPLVGPFLQACGAMWIRRSFSVSSDPLYTTLVQSYLDTMLQQGYNLECFVEGGRSRTGKLLQPKFGILSFMLDSVISGRVEDAFICPVSTQYDKVLEVDAYVNELLGQPKKKENLQDFLSSSSALSLKLGSCHVRFSEPWSLKEFIEAQKARPSHLENVDQTNSSATDRTRILRTLGYKVLSDINNVAVVMPTALVGTVLLTLRGRGVTRSELSRRVDWLCDRIKENGGQVAEFHGAPTDAVAERAIGVLGVGLVGKVEGLAEETYYAVDRFQLSFYRNMTIHLFIPESLVSVALYTRVKAGGAHLDQLMQEKELTEKVAFLSQLFRGEFIFPAGQGLVSNLNEAIERLQKHKVMEMVTNHDGVRRIGLTTTERQRGRENYDFYCFLLWPFVEAAWLGSVSLLSLVPPRSDQSPWLDMKSVQDSAQLLGKTLYHSGDLSYYEAVNKEALKNAYTRFQEEGIIVVGKGNDAKAGPIVRLADDWSPERDNVTSGRLWTFIESIAQCRREGKNRRDGATVSMRVFSLTASLGANLFEKAGDASASQTEILPQTVQRRSRL